VARLRRENAALGHVAVAEPCDALAAGAAVIITGQQPGLFGGTLLTFEKAAAAVRAAAAATAAGAPCVAVFWSQSEDHDLEEVNRFEREHETGFERTSLPLPHHGERLGDLRLDAASVDAALELLRASGGELGPAAARPIPGERFSDWTLRVVVEVLGPLGMLVADPRWFRDLQRPLLTRAIREVESFEAAFRADTATVRAAGYEPQIAPAAPGGLFLVDDAGRRSRLTAGSRWSLEGGGAFSADELVALLERDPDRFSPNVQLRPLTQSVLFPVAAQIGGPAEVAYFAQFPSLYRVAGFPLPVMIPRPSSTVLGVKEAKAREALALDAVTLLDDPASWPPEPDVDGSLASLFGDVAAAEEAAWEKLVAAADNDPLRRAVDGFRDRGRQSRDKLRETFRREAERKAGVDRHRRRKLAEWTFPKGKPQERILSGPHLWSRAGLPAFRRWLSELDPFDGRHLVCTLEPEDRP
jgi:bacillithiol biosynthesis cysteine-adding enzyme BshC